MTEFRWILILLGLGIVAGVYVWDRRRSRQRTPVKPHGRVEPRLESSEDWEHSRSQDEFPGESHAQQDWPGASDEVGRESVSRPGQAVGEPSKILVVHVRAHQGQQFTGPELASALGSEGLQYGENGAFHYLSPAGEPLFTVANMMEPGSFPSDDLESFTTQGVSAFMVLPGPGDVTSLSRMISSARRLAKMLGGEALDESGSTLTNQRATYLREEVIEFQRRSQIGTSES